MNHRNAKVKPHSNGVISISEKLGTQQRVACEPINSATYLD